MTLAYIVDVEADMIHRAMTKGQLVIPRAICEDTGEHTRLTDTLPVIEHPEHVCVSCFPSFFSTHAAHDPGAWPGAHEPDA